MSIVIQGGLKSAKINLIIQLFRLEFDLLFSTKNEQIRELVKVTRQVCKKE